MAAARPKVSMRMRWVSMPQMVATCGCSETARIALPRRVRSRNRYTPTANTIDTSAAAARGLGSTNSPSTNKPESSSTDLKSEVKISSPVLSNTMDKP